MSRSDTWYEDHDVFYVVPSIPFSAEDLAQWKISENLLGVVNYMACKAIQHGYGNTTNFHQAASLWMQRDYEAIIVISKEDSSKPNHDQSLVHTFYDLMYPGLRVTAKRIAGGTTPLRDEYVGQLLGMGFIKKHGDGWKIINEAAAKWFNTVHEVNPE